MADVPEGVTQPEGAYESAVEVRVDRVVLELCRALSNFAERALSDKTNRHHMCQQVDITCFKKKTSHVSTSRHHMCQQVDITFQQVDTSHVSTSRHHMCQQHSVGRYQRWIHRSLYRPSSVSATLSHTILLIEEHPPLFCL